MNNPSVLEAGSWKLEEVVPTILPLSLALAGRRHWTDYGMAPHARAAQRASCIEQQAYAVAVPAIVPAAVAIVISCSPLTTSGKARAGARERGTERELSLCICEMQPVALPRPPRMNPVSLHLEGATPHRVARFGLSLSTPSCYIWAQLLSDAGTLITIT